MLNPCTQHVGRDASLARLAHLAQQKQKTSRVINTSVSSTPSVATISFNGLADQPEISHL